MFKAKAITAVIVTGIFGLAACGGGSSDKDDSTVTTLRQKNSAPTTTTASVNMLPSKGPVILVKPQITAPANQPTTTVVLLTPTSIVRGVGTTVKCLPPKKWVGPFCK